ncbi:MAG: GtrA family protein [Rhodopseudomonas palustris]|uniref:GtrA family protein n=1 Tax=Rhodopseudomonas palustris TaxID=1076 RepID=A0A933S228_RHOPL|nr:GtrA family protein [Rhodopseudomonas palustris]
MLFSLRRRSEFDQTPAAARAFDAAPALALQGLRFIITGVSSYVLYIVLFYFLSRHAGEYVSLVVSYVVAAAAHFVASKYFTFLHKSSVAIRAEVLKFGVLLCMTTVVNWGAFYGARTLLHLDTSIALFIGIVASSAISFTVMRAWVFVSK